MSLTLTLWAVRALAQPAPPPATPELGGANRGNSAALTGANPSEYQRFMSLGLEEFGQGNWAEARALFLRGHALSPNARSFRALGMTAFNLRRYPEALRELTRALEDPRRPLTLPLVDATRVLQDKADTFVGRYKLLLDPTTAELRVDGVVTRAEPNGELLLAVGEHSLEVEATGHKELKRPITVDGTDGETLRLTLVPLTIVSAPGPTQPPAPAPPPPPTRQVLRDYRWSFILGAGALGFAAGATALQVKAVQEDRAVAEECKGDCSPIDDVTTRRDQLQATSIALWVTCGVLTATTLVMVLVEKGRVQKREAMRRALTF